MGNNESTNQQSSRGDVMQYTVADAQAFACKTCKAAAGEPCVSKTGKRVSFQHSNRWDSARMKDIKERVRQRDPIPLRPFLPNDSRIDDSTRIPARVIIRMLTDEDEPIKTRVDHVLALLRAAIK